jgi:hypothetical protein
MCLAAHWKTAFLADNDQSSFMTGHPLIVDGGATIRLSTE